MSRKTLVRFSNKSFVIILDFSTVFSKKWLVQHLWSNSRSRLMWKIPLLIMSLTWIFFRSLFMSARFHDFFQKKTFLFFRISTLPTLYEEYRTPLVIQPTVYWPFWRENLHRRCISSIVMSSEQAHQIRYKIRIFDSDCDCDLTVFFSYFTG